MCHKSEQRTCNSNCNDKMCIQQMQLLFFINFLKYILHLSSKLRNNYNKEIRNEMTEKENFNHIDTELGFKVEDFLKIHGVSTDLNQQHDKMSRFKSYKKLSKFNEDCWLTNECQGKKESMKEDASDRMKESFCSTTSHETIMDVKSPEIDENKSLKMLTDENEAENSSVQAVSLVDETEAVKKPITVFKMADLEQPLSNLKKTTYCQVCDMKNTEMKDETYEIKKISDGPDNDRTELVREMFMPQHFRIKLAPSTVYTLYNAAWHPKEINGLRWQCFNHEKNRLFTYAQYPHSAKKSAVLLAEAGFSYYGSGKANDDKVICYFCHATKQDWLELDVISDIHRRLSPDCPMVTGVNCSNVKMIIPSDQENLWKQIYGSRETNFTANKKPSSQRDNEIAVDCPTESEGHNQGASHARSNQPPAHKPLQMAKQTVMKSSLPATSQSVIASSMQSSSSSTSSGTTNRIQTRTNIGNPSSGSATSTSGTNAQQVSQQSTGSTSSSHTAHYSSIANQTNSSVASNSSTVNQNTTLPQQGNLSQTPAGGAQGNSSQAPSSSTDRNPTQTAAGSSVGGSAQASTGGAQSQNTQASTSGAQSQNIQASTGGAQSQNKTPTYSELGIITERPKRFEYAVRATRYATFDNWPRDHFLKKEDLADAGFYYAGYGDCARCFYCGGGLRNWEDGDDVWVEHGRWFSKCAYIRQTMGQQFVDAVQDLNKSHDKISFKMVTDKIGSSAASFQLDSRQTPLIRDPAVLTVKDMGYTIEEVVEAAAFVKEKYSVLSSDKLYEKLKQDGKEPKLNAAQKEPEIPCDGSTSDPSQDEEDMNNLKEQNFQLRQQTVCKICMDKEVAVVFLPCGHLVSCTDCAAAMKDCPVCRKQVRGIVRAFMG